MKFFLSYISSVSCHFLFPYIYVLCFVFLIVFYHVSLSRGVSCWCNAMNGEHSINIAYKVCGLDVSGPQQRATMFRT